MAGDFYNLGDETPLAAPEVVHNGSPIELSRFGGFCRSVADTKGQALLSSNWYDAIRGNTSYGFGGVIHEVIVFNRKLSDPEREKVYAYLAKKYSSLGDKLPDSYHWARNSAAEYGLTYWNIEHHPNTKDLNTIPVGAQFGGISLENFLAIPDTIYKSAGTRLADGTVLSSDTYTSIGS